MIQSSSQSNAAPRVLGVALLNPLLILSLCSAALYGAFGSHFYQSAPPYVVGALVKASSVVALSLVALQARSRLLAAGLFFGALGDAALAWSESTFVAGAIAFLIGHLCYITLFVRRGFRDRWATLKPWRLAAMLVTLTSALAMTSVLVPHNHALFVPLGIYTGVLTVMTMTSLALPAQNWPATLGALLFFISDGFVALNMFHTNPDPEAAFWLSFSGWMIYWAGQAALCIGASGLCAPSPRVA